VTLNFNKQNTWRVDRCKGYREWCTMVFGLFAWVKVSFRFKQRRGIAVSDMSIFYCSDGVVMSRTRNAKTFRSKALAQLSQLWHWASHEIDI